MITAGLVLALLTIIWLVRREYRITKLRALSPQKQSLDERKPRRKMRASNPRISTIIQGVGHYSPHFIRAECRPGMQIALIREPKNTHDANAIAVYAAGVKIGHIRRNLAGRLSPKIDQGMKFPTKILSMYAPKDWTWPRVTLEIDTSALRKKK